MKAVKSEDGLYIVCRRQVCTLFIQADPDPPFFYIYLTTPSNFLFALALLRPTRGGVRSGRCAAHDGTLDGRSGHASLGGSVYYGP